MTVPAGFDIAAISGQQTAASSTPPKAATAHSTRHLRAFGAQPSGESAPGSFRADLEALLPSLDETAQSTATAKDSSENNLITKESIRTTLGVDGLATADAIPPTQSQLPDDEPALSQSSDLLHAAKTLPTQQLLPSEIKISAASADKDAQPSSHARRASISSSDAEAAPQPATPQLLASETITAPVVPPAQPAPQQIASVEPSASLSFVASHARPAGDATAATPVIPIESHATPAVPDTTSIDAANLSKTTTLTYASSTSPNAREASIPAPLETTAQRTGKPASLNQASLAQTPSQAADAQELANKSTSRAISGANDRESLPAPTSGSTKLRESTPLRHELADIATPQPAGNSSTSPLHPSLIRDESGIHTVLSDRTSTATHLATPNASDAFAALDSAPNSASGQPDTTWLHASARRAEAGFLDPSLGWVSVRADQTASGLHAAVVPSSPEAAQTLSQHLAGLNSYLAENHSRTITASISSPEAAPQNFDQFGSNQNQQQGSAHSGESGQQGGSATDSSFFTASAPSASTMPNLISTLESATLSPARPGGISVVA